MYQTVKPQLFIILNCEATQQMCASDVFVTMEKNGQWTTRPEEVTDGQQITHVVTYVLLTLAPPCSSAHPQLGIDAWSESRHRQEWDSQKGLGIILSWQWKMSPPPFNPSWAHMGKH